MPSAADQMGLFDRGPVLRSTFDRSVAVSLDAWLDRQHEARAVADQCAPGSRPPRARRQDPLSSHRSADEIEGSGKIAEQLRAVLAAVRANPGSTTRELAGLADAPLGMDPTAWRYAIARRAPELADRGLVERRLRTGDDVRLWPEGAEIPPDAGERVDDRRRKRP